MDAARAGADADAAGSTRAREGGRQRGRGEEGSGGLIETTRNDGDDDDDADDGGGGGGGGESAREVGEVGGEARGGEAG